MFALRKMEPAPAHLDRSRTLTSPLRQSANPNGRPPRALEDQAGQPPLTTHPLQAKLAVNTPGDRYEQEADRIAEQVLSGPAGGRTAAAGLSIQRFSPGSQAQAQAPPGNVERVLAGSGTPLLPALRQEMEQRFSYDFSRVRIHSDGEAEQSARAINANAYTVGRHIVFGGGRYAPSTGEGRRLVAHELTHVVQQAGGGYAPAGGGDRALQRDDAADKKSDEGQVLTVVIRAPDDKYTQNVTDYVRNTLNDKNIIEVDNLQEIFPYLEKIKNAKGPKLKKIRLIAHGSTIGGIKMKMPGKKDREFINPSELEKMAQDKNLQAIAAGAMDTDSTVEFLGCYVGGSETTEASLSTMFQSEFRSPDEALHTEDLTYVWNKKTVTSTDTIDKAAEKDKKAKPQFENWLLKQHQRLVAAGDLPDVGSKDDKIAAMRDLFNRSHGYIKQLIIEKKSGEKVRPTQGQAWSSEWRKWKVN